MMLSPLYAVLAAATVSATPFHAQKRDGVDLWPEWDGIKALLEPLNLLVDGAYWRGTAPFCSDTCSSDELVLVKLSRAWDPDFDFTELYLAKNSDFGGSPCWFGTQKSLCARAGQTNCMTKPATLTISCENWHNIMQGVGIEFGPIFDHKYDGCSLVDPPTDPCGVENGGNGGQPIMVKQFPFHSVNDEGPPYLFTVDVEFSCCA